MRYLLDANILSDLIRNPLGRTRANIVRVGQLQIATSIIVAAELRFGAAKKQALRYGARVEALLSTITVLPFEPPADARYGEIRAQLEQAGTPIGSNDLFIAAQAMAEGLTLVTDNERAFCRVPGLNVENWLRAA